MFQGLFNGITIRAQICKRGINGAAKNKMKNDTKIQQGEFQRSIWVLCV